MAEADEKHLAPGSSKIEDVIRYAGEAAVIGLGVTITDSWVENVAAAYRHNPRGRYPEGVEPGSPITQTEIDAYLARVPSHAEGNGLFIKADTHTIVVAPYDDQVESYLSFEYGTGIYDDPEQLIVEIFGRFRPRHAYRFTLVKPTGEIQAEETVRGSSAWTRVLRAENELLESIRYNLALLPVGQYDGLRRIVEEWQFESPSLNEGRRTQWRPDWRLRSREQSRTASYR